MNSKRTLLERIKSLEDSIVKGREYLECGKHARWHRFQPWFVKKVKDGEVLPPHRNLVKNVFIPRYERALAGAEKKFEKLNLTKKEREKKSTKEIVCANKALARTVANRRSRRSL
jgi:hypothetical protein